jgi:hypothetical protein
MPDYTITFSTPETVSVFGEAKQVRDAVLAAIHNAGLTVAV